MREWLDTNPEAGIEGANEFTRAFVPDGQHKPEGAPHEFPDMPNPRDYDPSNAYASRTDTSVELPPSAAYEFPDMPVPDVEDYDMSTPEVAEVSVSPQLKMGGTALNGAGVQRIEFPDMPLQLY